MKTTPVVLLGDSIHLRNKFNILQFLFRQDILLLHKNYVVGVKKLTPEETQLFNDIGTEITTLSNTMKSTGNIFPDKLRKRLAFLKWVNKSWSLRFATPPRVVKQKEVFFCYLGENIGSEQNGKRPVVIMQNNIGNYHGNTTIVVPITTYEGSSFYEKDGKRCMSYLNNGNTIERFLDFYEVEVQIESSASYPIHGIANVVHMREVSKIRLAKTPVATITDQTYNDIASAISKNISKIP